MQLYKNFIDGKWVDSEKKDTIKVDDPATGKIIKIAGGFQPNYFGNALSLTDNGELWRGWNIADTPTWTQVTLTGIPTIEIVDLGRF